MSPQELVWGPGPQGLAWSLGLQGLTWKLEWLWILILLKPLSLETGLKAGSVGSGLDTRSCTLAWTVEPQGQSGYKSIGLCSEAPVAGFMGISLCFGVKRLDPWVWIFVQRPQ